MDTFLSNPFYLRRFCESMSCSGPKPKGERGRSVVRHLPLVLEVPGSSIPARGEENFGVRTRFP